ATPIDDIQALNPELRRWTTPVRTAAYDLKLPVGTGDLFRARLVETPPDAMSALQWHTVKRAESLATIAPTLNVKTADLADANFLTTRTKVTAGQQLIIPRAPTTLLAARTDSPDPVPAVEVAASRPVATPRAPAAVSQTSAKLEPEKVIYRV